MYDWINKRSLVEYIAQEEQMEFEHKDFRFEKIVTENTPDGITSLAQFFMVGSIWLADNYRIGIPVQDEDVLKLVMSEVAPHFIDVKQCVALGSVKEIYMQNVKPGSRMLFAMAKNGVLPVMGDLYRHHDLSERYIGRKRNVLHYTVNGSALQPYPIPDASALRTVLQKAYFDRNEPYVLLPTGWTFDDSLRDSAALRFFAGFVPCLSLVIDADSNEVITLHLSREESRHQIRLNSARPNPPRRNKDHLYLDIGRGLVYVINLTGQSPILNWDELKESTIYRLPKDQKYAEFDHEYGERLPEGRGLFFGEEWVHAMIDTVNRELKDASKVIKDD
ncbi:hypothetical protein SAMN04487895_103292 [Paenibacillus sophorae]|uniref:Uncharacterized protein n=1 Tax=Paenibacillus sophorae TaxID=1333845 RepID=A0A1H8K524_9BACL|nr:hypothetical protein [Paenibacillus sophorae]QWU13615.1 hypothetical protein KP014_16640 [Paenibacillus sophorae]SEN88082.1 hypothetical protein SAMN04487895_103292 [Paenibacillus sophorae]